jgi:hypothetical protein
VFLDDFLEICANICLRKLLVVAKESENIWPGNAELERKGEKRANLMCLVNVSRDITHSTSTRMCGEQSFKLLV